MGIKHHIRAILMTTAGLAFTACGSNVYTPLQSYDPADEAARYLEQKKPNDAINTLENALKDRPGEAVYVSMLALAYAQRAGVAPIDFLDDMDGATNGNLLLTNEITALFSVMPPATSSAINDVDYAITLLGQLGEADLNAAEKLKLSLFQTASTVLKVKILDTDGDGSVSTAELLDLSGATADSIIAGLQNAAALLSGGGATASDGSDVAVDKINAMISGISSQGAGNNRDNLAQYLQQ